MNSTDPLTKGLEIMNELNEKGICSLCSAPISEQIQEEARLTDDQKSGKDRSLDKVERFIEFVKKGLVKHLYPARNKKCFWQA